MKKSESHPVVILHCLKRCLWYIVQCNISNSSAIQKLSSNFLSENHTYKKTQFLKCTSSNVFREPTTNFRSSQLGIILQDLHVRMSILYRIPSSSQATCVNQWRIRMNHFFQDPISLTLYPEFQTNDMQLHSVLENNLTHFLVWIS